ncbi:hypothetical protein NG791_12850 [Laspinema sp. D1]|uniref:hypothetical protein n=1 Tax=Laspinema palackyanum TaxID=3231601 RepID=UPI00346B145A|nr:hypothetical protein [Laspinema sp. D2b]
MPGDPSSLAVHRAKKGPTLGWSFIICHLLWVICYGSISPILPILPNLPNLPNLPIFPNLPILPILPNLPNLPILPILPILQDSVG